MSGGSSMYGSTTEEQRQANEVRRLKRELTEAREQVMSLSSQLSTNVSRKAFKCLPLVCQSFSLFEDRKKRKLFVMSCYFS